MAEGDQRSLSERVQEVYAIASKAISDAPKRKDAPEQDAVIITEQDLLAFIAQQLARPEAGYHDFHHTGGFGEAKGIEPADKNNAMLVGLMHDLFMQFQSPVYQTIEGKLTQKSAISRLLGTNGEPKNSPINALIDAIEDPRKASELKEPGKTIFKEMTELPVFQFYYTKNLPIPDELKCELFAAVTLTNLGLPTKDIAKVCEGIYATFHFQGNAALQEEIEHKGNLPTSAVGLAKHWTALQSIFGEGIGDHPAEFAAAIRNHDLNGFKLDYTDPENHKKFYNDTISNIFETFAKHYPEQLISEDPITPQNMLEKATATQIALCFGGNAGFMGFLGGAFSGTAPFGFDDPKTEKDAKDNAACSSRASHIIRGLALAEMASINITPTTKDIAQPIKDAIDVVKGLGRKSPESAIGKWLVGKEDQEIEAACAALLELSLSLPTPPAQPQVPFGENTPEAKCYGLLVDERAKLFTDSRDKEGKIISSEPTDALKKGYQAVNQHIADQKLPEAASAEARRATEAAVAANPPPT